MEYGRIVRARRHLATFPALTAAVAAVALVALAQTKASADAGDASAPLPSDAGADAAREAGSLVSRTPPDPPPMSEREQWVFDLRWDRGDVYLLGVQKIDMGAPHPTPRAMGRFALELFEGPTLIERVRFDFPMLGVPEGPDAGMKTAPRFEPKLKTRIGVLFPATKRGTRLELWDRAKDQRWTLPWPPKEGPMAPADGGLSERRPSGAESAGP